MRVIPVIFLLFCILFTVPVGWSLIQDARLKKSLSTPNANKDYEFVFGVVVDKRSVRYGPGDYETHCLISYTVSGKKYFKTQRSLYGGCGSVGQKVGLYYHKNNPKKVVISNEYEPRENRSWSMILGGIVIIGVGVFYFLLLIGYLIYGWE